MVQTGGAAIRKILETAEAMRADNRRVMAEVVVPDEVRDELAASDRSLGELIDLARQILGESIPADSLQ